MDKRTAANAIVSFMDEYLFEPANVRWPYYELRKRSYQRFAAKTLRGKILYSDAPVMVTVKKFILFLKGQPSEDRDIGYMFEVMLETVTDIYDVLRAME